MLVDLPTVNHFEFVRWDMLALAAETVTSILDYKLISNPWISTLKAPEILGVQIYQAINGNQTSLEIVMDEFTKDPGLFRFDYLLALFFVMHHKKENNKAKEIIDYIMEK